MGAWSHEANTAAPDAQWRLPWLLPRRQCDTDTSPDPLDTVTSCDPKRARERAKLTHTLCPIAKIRFAIPRIRYSPLIADSKIVAISTILDLRTDPDCRLLVPMCMIVMRRANAWLLGDLAEVPTTQRPSSRDN